MNSGFARRIHAGLPFAIGWRWGVKRYERLQAWIERSFGCTAFGTPSVSRASREYERKARLLEDYLWRGRSNECVPHLEALIEDSAAPNRVQSYGRAALACWLHHHGQSSRALDLLKAGMVTDKLAVELPRFRRSIIALNILLGNFADARKFIDDVYDPAQTYDRLVAASAQEDDGLRLSLLSDIFTSQGFAPLKRDGAGPLSFGSLRGVRPSKTVRDRGKVSVIVPAFNCEETLEYCVRSICRQTYENLEILIVDDDSVDGSAKVAESLATGDKRISVWRHDRNLGVYHARNTGLALASGDFITVQDADDWSHPQRIEVQISGFDLGVLAVGSYWARFSSELRCMAWILSRHAPVRNFWSVIFRRDVFDAVGPWDFTRFGADGDFIQRLEAHGGEESVRWVKNTVPFAFGLHSEGSLTAKPETHISTKFVGPRHFNRCLSKYWYGTLGKVAREEQEDRTSLLPEVFFRKEREVLEVDLCIVGDFANSERVRAARQHIDANPGKVALYNLPDFSLTRDIKFDLDADFFELMKAERVHCVFNLADVNAKETVELQATESK